ncbi:phosphonate C-P lyase system protein PhnH [Pelagibius sp.]|uniref:phosphonate C-P lyase system protein PhnH n=1 Tax=Pelagibius sp. TaxID=1931238 RepID=UPI00261B1E86|nr:phosphonate C-P lyase system protein PhnH [Pelagibius sp.]
MALTSTPNGTTVDKTTVLSSGARAGIDTADLKPGLADPVHESQTLFRHLLDAMARPGRAVDLETALDAPTPLDPATAAVVLTLCDYDTPLWIDWIADTPPVRSYCRFHCGSALVERPDEAAFALVSDAENMPRLGLFAQGIDQYPDRSATLVVQLPDLEGGPERVLKGPGIATQAVLRAGGLPDWFWNDWRLNAAQFPLGVDIFFTSGRRIVGLPRTVLVEG